MLTVAATVLLSACGEEPAPEPAPKPQGKPLSVFSEYNLFIGTYSHIMDGGGVDPDNYRVTVTLSVPPWREDMSSECPPMSTQVVATLNGRAMTSHAEALGSGSSCDTPLFTLIIPKDQYDGVGGINGKLVIEDDSHSVIAEFRDFYFVDPQGEVWVLPTVRCDGVRECRAYSAQQ
jgi:hypothetical protein